MAILDSDILIAFLKGKPDAIQKITSLEETGDPISTTIITAYELLKGAYLSSNCEETLTKVKNALSDLQILDLTYSACEEAAKIYKNLKKEGSMIGEFDVLIAAIARVNDETIISRDEHFKMLIPHQKLAKW
jgi:predicted nucleic acid-binding protein